MSTSPYFIDALSYGRLEVPGEPCPAIAPFPIIIFLIRA
jgi:hypothetical protein